MVILIDSHPSKEWLLAAVEKRLRQELAKLGVEINEEKSRVVDLRKDEGFEYRYLPGRNGKPRLQVAPKQKKRVALFAKLKEVFRQNVSQPVQGVIAEINPILRGWVNYFRIGNASRCFSMVKRWVERKIRRHMMSARQRRGTLSLTAVQASDCSSRARDALVPK
jgi:RNA-directed DNA polymerase